MGIPCHRPEAPPTPHLVEAKLSVLIWLLCRRPVSNNFISGFNVLLINQDANHSHCWRKLAKGSLQEFTLYLAFDTRLVQQVQNIVGFEAIICRKYYFHKFLS